MRTVKTYYIVKCHGFEQGWDRSNPGVLEKPKPFEGYISDIDWAYGASPQRGWAHKFSAPPKIGRKEKGFYAIGPWWYNIERTEVIKVTETLETTEEIVS